MNVSSLLVIAFDGTQPTERGTACVLNINAKQHLCFPGAIEDSFEYYPLARWPESDPFPPSLPTGPSLPGWLLTGMCSGPDGSISAWSDLSKPPLATGALARCLAACFGTDGRVRNPKAEELADLYPDYRWQVGTWTAMEVLNAVQSIQGAGHD